MGSACNGTFRHASGRDYRHQAAHRDRKHIQASRQRVSRTAWGTHSRSADNVEGVGADLFPFGTRFEKLLRLRATTHPCTKAVERCSSSSVEPSSSQFFVRLAIHF